MNYSLSLWPFYPRGLHQLAYLASVITNQLTIIHMTSSAKLPLHVNITWKLQHYSPYHAVITLACLFLRIRCPPSRKSLSSRTEGRKPLAQIIHKLPRRVFRKRVAPLDQDLGGNLIPMFNQSSIQNSSWFHQ